MNSASAYRVLDRFRGEIAADPPETRTREERDKLILEHLPQVKLIAKNIRDRIPVPVSLEDLISTGTLGLIAAIERYDPSRNVKLRTYAEYKIRGAILDSLRDQDWAPRSERRHSKQIEKAIANLEQELGRTPGEEEIAERLGIPLAEYHDWLSALPSMSLGSLEEVNANGGGQNKLAYLADPHQGMPFKLLERIEVERMLEQALSLLPKVERTVLALYYLEELTLREISAVLHLHDSRICQLKSQAILRLRSYLAEDGE